MANADVLQQVLAKRRDRAIATMLGIKERECDRFLPPDAKAKLRKAILDQTNEMYELCLDLMRSLDRDDVVLNQIYFDKLEEVRDGVNKLLDRV